MEGLLSGREQRVLRVEKGAYEGRWRGGVTDVCTYHARLEEALAEAVRRTIREGVASGELKEWEQVRAELQKLESEARGLLQSICPADKALNPTLKNDQDIECA